MLYDYLLIMASFHAVVVFFTITWQKVRAELAIFFVEKARALHRTSFLLSVLL